MQQNIITEVVGLHHFFQDWFNGVLPASERAFERVEQVLAPSFWMITPDGNFVRREALIEGLKAAHRTRQNMRIWIQNTAIQSKNGDILTETYEEWQEINDKTTARISSAQFEISPSAPNGVHWLHVHETWLAAAEN